jgi:integrase
MLIVKSRHLERVIGADTPLAQVTARTIDRYVVTRLDEGKSRNTIHKELTTLRGALRLAKRRGEFAQDLNAVMPLDFSPKYSPRSRALSIPETDRLLEHFEKKPERRALLAFLLATGATYPSEVENAQRGDVTDRFVHLRGTKTATRNRRVPIVSYAQPWLKIALEHGPPFAPWTNIRRDLHLACTALTIEPISPNDIRRTFGHMLRASGVEPQLIAVAMGHVDGRMVEKVYGRITPEELAHLLEDRLKRSGRGLNRRGRSKKRGKTA